MVPELNSTETLKILSLLTGGVRTLHAIMKDSGFNGTYATLTRYINGNVQFDLDVYKKFFSTLREPQTHYGRDVLRNLEDAYFILNEMVAQGIITPRKEEGVKKETTLTSEEIKEMEAEFGVQLSQQEKDVLKGRRKSLPKSSISLDEMMGDDDPQPVEEKSKDFIEKFMEGGKDNPQPVQAELTDPFEAELRRTPDIFTSEEHRF